MSTIKQGKLIKFEKIAIFTILLICPELLRNASNIEYMTMNGIESAMIFRKRLPVLESTNKKDIWSEKRITNTEINNVTLPKWR